MSQKIKKLNIINAHLSKHIDQLSQECLKKDKEIFEDVVKEDIKLPKKCGKRGRPKKNK